MSNNKPKTFFISKNGRKQMDLIDKNPLSNQKRISKWYLLVPKWVVGVGLICSCLIAIIFIVTFVIVFTSPRPSLYGETCEQRSCLADHDLVCINKTCTCLQNQFFQYKCVNKKNYGEKCSASTPCIDCSNFVCRDGVCKCMDTDYLHNGSCLPKKTYKQSCTSDSECLTSLILNCDSKTKMCICNSNRYWGNYECQLKRTINETCTKTTDWIDSQTLLCTNGFCQCSSSNYWDIIHLGCYPKLYENNSCTANYQCYSPMTCQNTYCSCGTFQYHNISTFTCVNQKLINNSCVIDYNCRVDKGLQCNSSVCQCIFDLPVWSTTLNTCIQRRAYGQSVCSNQNECELGKSLICYKGASSNCNCPDTTTIGMCDCYRAFGNESYWDGNVCAPALTNGSLCENITTSYQCQTLTQGTICNLTGSDYFCQCPTYQYFNAIQNKCLNQETYNGLCTVTIGCRIDQGLLCISNTCMCNSTYQFWSSSLNKCMNYKTYANTCNTGECDPNASLICNTGTNCSCPTYLTAGHCDCTRVSGNEMYWNGTSCVTAIAFGGKCTAGKDYQCQTLAVSGVTCDSSGTCSCGSTGGLQSSTNSCVFCITNWKFIDPNCYRVGTNIDKSDPSKAHNGQIDASCGKTALSSTAQGTFRLAELVNPLVKAYFDTNSGGNTELWVDLHESSGNYVSVGGNWNIQTTDSDWCGNNPSVKGTCGYYKIGNCYADDTCGDATSRTHACQYTPP